MEQGLQRLLATALKAISAACSEQELDQVRIKFLGRKG
ncbi:MAG: phenylalanine--tRNA ligase subunit alpha, partial [Firmicutes bacterium]|nr:phenylalanine--tRNA ligase subunit alpha [Bacillota bacterium]